MNDIVEKEWLSERLQDKDIRVADCRFKLGSAEEGQSTYINDHIPGAIYFDLEKDLSGPVAEHGGRHPLPDLDKLKRVLEAAGISRETTVVAYDGGEGAFASRFWWLLKLLGHEKVYVLNGGYKGWINSGLPVSVEIPSYEKADFQIDINPEILASYEEVKKVVEDKNRKTVLIDSRETKRYLGLEEPIDKKAGHIPGAINKVWLESYENGSLKSSEEQEKRFAEIEKDQPVIVYCGSGVTAAPNFMALKKAGYKNVKLYAGSFSDWISYGENKIEIKNENPS